MGFFHKCRAITNGVRCTLDAEPDSIYCFIHRCKKIEKHGALSPCPGYRQSKLSQIIPAVIKVWLPIFLSAIAASALLYVGYRVLDHRDLPLENLIRTDSSTRPPGVIKDHGNLEGSGNQPVGEAKSLDDPPSRAILDSRVDMDPERRKFHLNPGSSVGNNRPYRLGDQEHQDLKVQELRRAADKAFDMGLYSDAEYFYTQTLSMYDSLEIGGRDKALVLRQLGVIAQDVERYPEAYKFYEESLRIEKGLDSRAGMTITTIHFGMLNMFQGNYSDAETKIRRGIRESEEISDKEGEEGVALGHQLLAEFYIRLSNLDKAKAHCDTALQYWEKLNDNRGRADIWHILGIIERRQGRYKRAHRLLTTGLRATYDLSPVDKRRVAAYTYQIGRNYHVQGQLKSAEEYYKTALSISIECRDIRTQAILYPQVRRIAKDKRE